MSALLNGDVVARVIDDRDEWHAITAEWQDLCSACSACSPTLEPVWLRTWWTVYGPSLRDAKLQIIVVRRGTRLIGVLPLYVHVSAARPLAVRRLGFVATGEAEHEEVCSDYMDLICRPEDASECADAAWDVIGRLAWDYLELLDVPSTSRLIDASRRPARLECESRGQCPVADLSGGFEAYLQRLSANTRQQARRLIREGERAGARFHLADPQDIDQEFATLTELHRARWAEDGQPGVFSAPKFEEFHRAIIQEWLPRERVAIGALQVGTSAVASVYGFVKDEWFQFYQSGVRPSDSTTGLKSPGTLAHLMMMQALSERGVTKYDFLRGSSNYKERLATTENRLVELRTWRQTLRGAANQSVRRVVAAARRARGNRTQ